MDNCIMGWELKNEARKEMILKAIKMVVSTDKDWDKSGENWTPEKFSQELENARRYADAVVSTDVEQMAKKAFGDSKGHFPTYFAGYNAAIQSQYKVIFEIIAWLNKQMPCAALSRRVALADVAAKLRELFPEINLHSRGGR